MRTKVLFICSGNIDRSPTAEALLKFSSKYVSRSAGISEDAPVQVSRELLEWADLILAMQELHRKAILRLMPKAESKTEVLNIPDKYEYCEPALVRLLRERLRSSGIVVPDVLKGECGNAK